MVDEKLANLIRRINSQPHDQLPYLILADRLAELGLYDYESLIRTAARATQADEFIADSDQVRSVFPKSLFPDTRAIQSFNRFGIHNAAFMLLWQAPTEDWVHSAWAGFRCWTDFNNWRAYGPNILRHYGRPAIKFDHHTNPRPGEVSVPAGASRYDFWSCFWHDGPFASGSARSNALSSAVVPFYIWKFLKQKESQAGHELLGDDFGAVFETPDQAIDALYESMLDWAQDEASIPLYAKAETSPEKLLELVGPGGPSHRVNSIQVEHRIRCLNPLIS